MEQFSSFPHAGYVRLPSIIGDRKCGKPGLLPIGSTSWWNGVKSGRFPKPVKLGPRITAWRVEDIRALLETFERGAAGPNSTGAGGDA